MTTKEALPFINMKIDKSYSDSERKKTKTEIVSLVEDGFMYKDACRVAGVHKNLFEYWMSEDNTFLKDVVKARAEMVDTARVALLFAVKLEKRIIESKYNKYKDDEEKLAKMYDTVDLKHSHFVAKTYDSDNAQYGINIQSKSKDDLLEAIQSVKDINL